MLIDTYNQYLNSFNSKNYDDVLEFWAPEFVVFMNDVVLFNSATSLKKFYSFLHSYIKEEIHIDRYLSDEDSLFMEARVRITALRDLDQATIDLEGIKGIMPIKAGVAYDIPQIIHYHLEHGKFITAHCLVSGPVIPL